MQTQIEPETQTTHPLKDGLEQGNHIKEPYECRPYKGPGCSCRGCSVVARISLGFVIYTFLESTYVVSLLRLVAACLESSCSLLSLPLTSLLFHVVWFSRWYRLAQACLK